MKFEINLVFVVLVVLTGSTLTNGQSSVLPPVLIPPALPHHAGTSASPDLTEDPGNKVPKGTQSPAGTDGTTTGTAAFTKSEFTVTNAASESHLLSTSSAATTSPHTDVPVVMTAHTGATSSSAAADGLSSTPTPMSTTAPLHVFTTENRTLLTTDPNTTAITNTTAAATFSSEPAHTVQDVISTAHASTTQLQSESSTTGRPSTSAPDPAGPTHQEVPSELNVGDEGLKGSRYHSSSPLDPLLAGLLSVFIVTTAIVFVILFLKFRQRTNHPEFHRLQDLPMDDLMEDTPLSRYTY